MTDLRYLSSEDGFLGLDSENSPPPEEARAVIVPFGLEATVSYEGGTAKGPQAMLDASHEVELFDEEFWFEPVHHYGVATLEPPKIEKPVEKALDQLAAITGEILSQDRFPMVFGGEHSITPGAIRPFLEQVPDLVVLHFDAHADLRDGYNGEKFSHASAIRRILDDPSAEVVSVGIRNISQSEIGFYEDNRDRIHIHWAKDKALWTLDKIIEPLRDRPIYLTFDLDGFDGSVMPATGTPEPGGLFWDDVMAIIRKAADVGDIIGADINELAPRPNLHGCDFLAAKLAYKILSFAHLGMPEKRGARPSNQSLH
ncbi:MULTISPECIES: agmatinase [Iodidimonas]|jgi:agmatinase|uniref:Agmatinase n=1 Tax=Iodidimonas nitroreducens TaxID=1236968 RepID=A0A5A7N8S0_9PROT|nr:MULTISPECIES: agmatinase [Iodidimonas]GAK33030.1 agmatinase 1 [alpha proteobacterium Q-1]GER03459.1 agmatinase [Iodidimonas nitroreducens]